MSFTYKPKKRKRSRTHGFLKRKRSAGGKKTVARRRQKGRKRLTV
ncbi:MAG TPA: 50S ribosomal protein L34 [Candidatus Paceibacterota bacterium]